MFLGFANFYKRFIRNFSRIAAPLTLILQITNKPIGNEAQSTQIEKQNIPSDADNAGSAGDVGNAGGTGSTRRSIKNLSIGAKSIKSKKPDLSKANFVKKNSSGTDFLVL